MPTATPLSFGMLRKELAVARRSYFAIARQRVSDQAPTEEQHRYWRAHDAAKGVYGALHWRYEKTILRWTMAALAVVTVVAVVVPVLTPLIGLAALVVLWRVSIIVGQLVPFERDA